MAELFNKSVYNIDRQLDEIDWEAEMSIDEDCYKDYKINYIKTPGTPEAPFWQVAAEQFMKF